MTRSRWTGARAVQGSRGEPADGNEVAVASQQALAIGEPAPPGELVGQGAGRLEILGFFSQVHSRILTTQGELLHLPGS